MDKNFLIDYGSLIGSFSAFIFGLIALYINYLINMGIDKNKAHKKFEKFIKYVKILPDLPPTSAFDSERFKQLSEDNPFKRISASIQDMLAWMTLHDELKGLIAFCNTIEEDIHVYADLKLLRLFQVTKLTLDRMSMNINTLYKHKRGEFKDDSDEVILLVNAVMDDYKSLKQLSKK